MAITSNGLQQLGFTLDTDYVLQDNSDGNGIVIAEWKSGSPQPTEAEIESAHNEWQAEYDAQEYARDRQEEYPSIGDQLDMLWHAIDGDATLKSDYADFHTAIKTVKDANPK